MPNYSNRADLPISIAVFLATDNYVPNEDILSATQLIKPLRKLILEHRLRTNPPKGIIPVAVDIMTMMKSRKGTAVHEGIENAWNDKARRDKGLLALGYPEKSLDRFVVNVEPEDLYDDDIPIYTERFVERELDGYWFGGTADFICQGRLEDFKNTSTYSYGDKGKLRSYQLQGSIYRWAEPKIITEDVMSIIEMYDDWTAAKSYQKGYPSHQIMKLDVPLLTPRATETFIRNKMKLIQEQIDLPEDEIDHCTDEELWRKADSYKYFTKSTNVKASSVHSTFEEARLAQINNAGKGEVRKVKGKAIACNFCEARVICSQYKSLVANQEIDVKD